MFGYVRRFLIGLVLLCLFLVSWLRIARGADIPSPLAEVKETIESLRGIARDPSLAGDANKTARHAKIRKLMLERIRHRCRKYKHCPELAGAIYPHHPKKILYRTFARPEG